jgi:hypothetical protein
MSWASEIIDAVGGADRQLERPGGGTLVAGVRTPITYTPFVPQPRATIVPLMSIRSGSDIGVQLNEGQIQKGAIVVYATTPIGSTSLSGRGDRVAWAGAYYEFQAVKIFEDPEDPGDASDRLYVGVAVKTKDVPA